jgi:hypothetical protein
MNGSVESVISPCARVALRKGLARSVESGKDEVRFALGRHAIVCRGDEFGVVSMK